MVSQDTVIRRVSELFRLVRKAHGLRQKDIARELGLSQGAVSKLEMGKATPDLQTWFTFVEHFQVADEAGRDEGVFESTKKRLEERVLQQENR